jgi:hypothetical protein
MQAQFLIPMAISIAGGVAFATLLTLFFIPCLLVILNDLRRLTYYLWNLEWPTREEVEPAWYRKVDVDAEYRDAKSAEEDAQDSGSDDTGDMTGNAPITAK